MNIDTTVIFHSSLFVTTHNLTDWVYRKMFFILVQGMNKFVASKITITGSHPTVCTLYTVVYTRFCLGNGNARSCHYWSSRHIKYLWGAYIRSFNLWCAIIFKKNCFFKTIQKKIGSLKMWLSVNFTSTVPIRVNKVHVCEQIWPSACINLKI